MHLNNQTPHFDIKYRPDVDGLRAVAVLAVVFFHAFPKWFKSGFIGVDVFFVISGFLISSIIFTNFAKNTFSFADFYARRIRRIFPSLIVVILFCLAVGWFFLIGSEFRELGKHIAAGSAYISNFILLSESGYFDTTSDLKVLLHFWSLAIEEQFYIVWPLLLYSCWKKKWSILKAILIFLTLSFLYNIFSSHRDFMFYFPLTRFWEMLIGTVLAYMAVFKKDELSLNQKMFGHLFTTFGLVLLLLGFVFINEKTIFPSYWALLPTIGTVFIIAAGPAAWFNKRVLSNKLAIWIGLISYPLYLWHWPVLTLLRIHEGTHLTPKTKILAVVISFILSYLTYHLIEKPIRFNKKTKEVTIILFVLNFILGVVGLVIYSNQGFLEREIAKKNIVFEYNTKALGYVECPRSEITPNKNISYCEIAKSSPPTAAIIGDSHAEDKFHGLAKLDEKRNWIVMGQGSCPPVIGIQVIGYSSDCEEISLSILNWLQTKTEIKTVLISYFAHYFQDTSYAAEHVRGKMGPPQFTIKAQGMENKTRAEIFFQGLDNTVSFLERADKNVILAVDIPELPYETRDCVRKNLNCSPLDLKIVQERQAPVRKMIQDLKMKHPKLQIFDPMSLFCLAGKCGYNINQTMMYRDSHHLSLIGSDKYAELFLQQFP